MTTYRGEFSGNSVQTISCITALRCTTDVIPSASSSIEMSSNCSISSMISLALLILITIAALPLLRFANLNLRRESLMSCGMSTVRDCRVVHWQGRLGGG